MMLALHIVTKVLSCIRIVCLLALVVVCSRTPINFSFRGGVVMAWLEWCPDPQQPDAVVCGDVTSLGISAPQLFASNTLIVTNTSDFSDDFLTKNWAGWSKLQISNNSAASDSGRPAPVRAHHDQR